MARGARACNGTILMSCRRLTLTTRLPPLATLTQILGRRSGAQTSPRERCRATSRGDLDRVSGPGRELSHKHRLEVVRDIEEEHGEEQEQPLHIRRGRRPRVPTNEERQLSALPQVRHVQGLQGGIRETPPESGGVRRVQTANNNAEA